MLLSARCFEGQVLVLGAQLSGRGEAARPKTSTSSSVNRSEKLCFPWWMNRGRPRSRIRQRPARTTFSRAARSWRSGSVGGEAHHLYSPS